MLVGGALLALLGVPNTGCNVMLGIDDHEAIPPTCGVDSNIGAVAGFADVRSGHCYSHVEFNDAANRQFAVNECVVGGGYLACITDEEEFDIINQNVVGQAWLGMSFDNAGRPICPNGEAFDPQLPIFSSGDSGGSGCAVFGGASVGTVGCNSEEYTSWVCEYELGEDE